MNTPRKAVLSDADLLELAGSAGIAESRIRLLGSADDPAVADYTQLTDVRLRTLTEPERGLFIAESSKIIRRAVAAGHAPRSFLMNRKWFPSLLDLLAVVDCPIFIGEDDVVESLTGYHLHRGALAAMHRPVLPSLSAVLESARRVVVVEDVVDHTNLGAIFRSAAGLGVDAVLITPRSADPLYRRSIRVSMGTVFQIPWTRLESWPQDIEALHELGFHTVALALEEDSVPLQEFALRAPDRTAVIMGTEGDGLQRRTIAGARTTVLIPMSNGVDSLNVAAATAVACFALQPPPGSADDAPHQNPPESEGSQ
ncbi:RNA methyltransferase [Brevibacterium daeguense]|uniref:RNA methyltransferase n=1 Tax=Brevibacterium daeguense TaxID=909936 RepID=A0ABP8ENW9_9MICO|nr:RNA methyltransferase [Brevibacterium daeguense]